MLAKCKDSKQRHLAYMPSAIIKTENWKFFNESLPIAMVDVITDSNRQKISLTQKLKLALKAKPKLQILGPVGAKWLNCHQISVV